LGVTVFFGSFSSAVRRNEQIWGFRGHPLTSGHKKREKALFKSFLPLLKD
jgi:hypothetical protein